MISERSTKRTGEGKHVTHYNIAQVVAARRPLRPLRYVDTTWLSLASCADRVAALAEFLVCVDVDALLPSLDTDSSSDCGSEGTGVDVHEQMPRPLPRHPSTARLRCCHRRHWPSCPVARALLLLQGCTPSGAGRRVGLHQHTGALRLPARHRAYTAYPQRATHLLKATRCGDTLPWSSTLVRTTDSLSTATQKHSHSPALIDIGRRERCSVHPV